MLLAGVKDINKWYGIEQVLSEISFTVEEGEKIGIVGPNGAGKSTLLKIIAGLEESDGGEVTLRKGATIGYLSQENDFQEGNTLYDELLRVFEGLLEIKREMELIEKEIARPQVYNDERELTKKMELYSALRERFEQEEGYSVQSKIRGICSGLCFNQEDLQKDISKFSGGQKTRIALAKLLLFEPDLLLLDEPTNHLDIQACEWLEMFLQDYPKAVLLVSHDRYFLDQIVERIVEIEGGKAKSYKGNYTQYMQTKERDFILQSKESELHRKRIARIEEYIRRNKAGVNAKQARGRAKLLEKMNIVEKPKSQESVRFSFKPAKTAGEQVLVLSGVQKAYGQKELFSDIDILIRRGEKIALLGANGTGKTTLLKIISGRLQADAGQVIYGKNLSIGYYDQELGGLDLEQTVLEEIRNVKPISEEEARSFLASFLFKGDDVFKKISVLSGGEKSRLLLAKLILEENNFLILDEPTNHLDIQSKQVLEDALNDFDGTLLVVSHDRYFLDQVVEKVFELESGRIRIYPGDYTYYRWKKEEEKNTAEVALSLQESGKNSKNELKVEEAQRREERKKAARIAEIEDEITKLEQQKEYLAQEMSKDEVCADNERVQALSAEYQEIEQKLFHLYERWEEVI
jgi:ATP-binding cassette subfamily F protein 3